MNKISTNGECMKCIHHFICMNEFRKQDLISTLIRKIDFDFKPFDIMIKCPNYQSEGGYLTIS